MVHGVGLEGAGELYLVFGFGSFQERGGAGEERARAGLTGLQMGRWGRSYLHRLPRDQLRVRSCGKYNIYLELPGPLPRTLALLDGEQVITERFRVRSSVSASAIARSRATSEQRVSPREH